jgi:hypothetical protein
MALQQSMANFIAAKLSLCVNFASYSLLSKDALQSLINSIVGIECTIFLGKECKIMNKKHAHYKLLAMFFTFNVLLPSLDIFSDIWTAFRHYENGHVNWSSATIAFVFAPFLARYKFHDQFFSLRGQQKSVESRLIMANSCCWLAQQFIQQLVF